jgi:hypothetical protein
MEGAEHVEVGEKTETGEGRKGNGFNNKLRSLLADVFIVIQGLLGLERPGIRCIRK